MNIVKYQTQWAEAMRPHVDGPLIAVGSFTRAGQTMAGMASFGSGAAYMVMNRKAKQKSAGLPQNMVGGLTQSSFYLWKYAVKYGTTKLKIKGDPAMVLDRSSFAVTIGGNDGLADRVHFWLPQPDGSTQTFELDSNSAWGGRDLNAAILQQLVAPGSLAVHQQVPPQ